MGKMKPVKIFLAAICTLLAIYFVLRVFGALGQGYSWDEMDWNQDGTTSNREFLAASDVGKREITMDGKKCTEYFSYKDGLAVETVCPR